MKFDYNVDLSKYAVPIEPKPPSKEVVEIKENTAETAEQIQIFNKRFEEYDKKLAEERQRAEKAEKENKIFSVLVAILGAVIGVILSK